MGQPDFAPIWEARARVLNVCRAVGMPLGPVVSSTTDYHAAVAAGFSTVSTPVDGLSDFDDILAEPRAKL